MKANGKLSTSVFKFRRLKALAVRNTEMDTKLPGFSDSGAKVPSTLRSIDVRGSRFTGRLPADWSGNVTLPDLTFIGLAGTETRLSIPSGYFEEPLYDNLTIAVGKVGCEVVTRMLKREGLRGGLACVGN